MLSLLKRSGRCCRRLPSSSIKDVISKPKQVGEVTARWKDTILSQTCLVFTVLICCLFKAICFLHVSFTIIEAKSDNIVFKP